MCQETQHMTATLTGPEEGILGHRGAEDIGQPNSLPHLLLGSKPLRDHVYFPQRRSLAICNILNFFA